MPFANLKEFEVALQQVHSWSPPQRGCIIHAAKLSVQRMRLMQSMAMEEGRSSPAVLPRPAHVGLAPMKQSLQGALQCSKGMRGMQGHAHGSR